MLSVTNECSNTVALDEIRHACKANIYLLDNLEMYGESENKGCVSLMPTLFVILPKTAYIYSHTSLHMLIFNEKY